MYGIYYKNPLNFQDIIEKKELEKTNLDTSIAQYINLAVTTSFGECKFQELFGCKVWEIDFDLLVDNNMLRDRIKKDITETIKTYENRLSLTAVEIIIGVSRTSYNNSFRLKKKIYMSIEGFVKKTNRQFHYNSSFFVGPLSY